MKKKYYIYGGIAVIAIIIVYFGFFSKNPWFKKRSNEKDKTTDGDNNSAVALDDWSSVVWEEPGTGIDFDDIPTWDWFWQNYPDKSQYVLFDYKGHSWSVVNGAALHYLG